MQRSWSFGILIWSILVRNGFSNEKKTACDIIELCLVSSDLIVAKFKHFDVIEFVNKIKTCTQTQRRINFTIWMESTSESYAPSVHVIRRYQLILLKWENYVFAKNIEFRKWMFGFFVAIHLALNTCSYFVNIFFRF